MEILAIIQAIIGFIIVFFAFGWIIMSKFHEELWKKIIYSVAVSVAACIIIATILGLIGIFSILSFLLAYIIICIIALLIRW